MSDNSNLLPQDAGEDETSLRHILKLATPMMVTLISFTIMQFVDRYMVSHLGTEALAAILPAGTLSFVSASLALGVVATVSTFVSQCLGRGDNKDCSNFCWQAIYLGLAYFVVAIAALWPSAYWIFRALGHEAEVVAMEVVYFRIMLYVHFSALIIWCCSHFFMGTHRPQITMYSAIIGHVINVIANYILIFGHFGFPAMGIAGAAWGTFIGVTVEAVIMLCAFVNGDSRRIYKSRQSMRIDLGKMASLLRIGFPAGISFMINVAFFGVILFGLIGRFGKEALAATSAALACTNMAIMPIIGLKNALTATVGKSIGKGRKDIAVKQTYTCLRAGTIYVVTMGICFIVFREPLMRFWSADETVIAIGVNVFIFSAVFQVFDSIFHIYNGALRGAGDTMWPSVVSATGAVVILGIGGFCMARFFPELGAQGPWIGAVANIFIVMLAMRWRFRSNHWMKIDLFKHEPPDVRAGIETVIE